MAAEMLPVEIESGRQITLINPNSAYFIGISRRLSEPGLVISVHDMDGVQHAHAEFSLPESSWNARSTPDGIRTERGSVDGRLSGHCWLEMPAKRDGYRLLATHYSNKGPLFVVTDNQGNELSRIWFDLSTEQWQTP